MSNLTIPEVGKENNIIEDNINKDVTNRFRLKK